MAKKSTIIVLVFIVLSIQHTLAQVFPNPISLSTGQGTPGSNDPLWLVSQQCFSSAPPNPTSASVTFSPAVIQNPYNAAWINPSTLPAPVNNGDWIGFSATSGSGDNSGCYRYYRLPITLPANCGVQSVTVAGSYVLTFDGYVDNTITAVYVNGVNMGIIAGGSFSAGTQLTFSLPGPWLVGLNYIDIQVFNGPFTSPDPSGLLLVASPSAGSADSDGDGVTNINDACPCTAGTTYNGCPAPNNCNLTAIRSAYTSAGCTELTSCYNGCSLYFYYPVAGTSAAAESFAQTLGGHIVSIQSATENACLSSELNSHGYSGVIWIGYTDVITEGTFLWLDGSPFGYTNWAPGEPNNAGGNENCTQMYPNGQWNDLNCSLGAASILEVGLCPQATIVTPTPVFCLGASTTLSISTAFGSAPYSYTWSPAAGLSATNVANPTASPSVTTTYTATSIDRYGCTAYAYTTLTVNPLPLVTANSATICQGQQTATLTAAGASTYSWSPATGLSSTAGAVVVASPSVNTTYTIIGTHTNGCTKTITAQVTVNPTPTITTTSGTICVGQQTVALTASGGVTYSWTPASGLSATTGSTVNASPLVTTTYSVGGINANGCANYTTTTVTVKPLPVLSANNATICIGQQTATITANGGVTYSWTPAAGLSATTGSVVNANPTTSTTYSIGGIGANGCLNYTTFIVSVKPLPLISANSSSICLGQQTATLTASGASTYSWSPAATLSSSVGTTVNGTPTVNTTYTIIGTDVNGCVNGTTTSIRLYALPTASLSVNTKTICIGNSITITPSGANSYVLTPGNLFSTSNYVLTPTVNTVYSVVGTNTNNCYSTNNPTVAVTVYTLPIISAQSDATINIGQTATVTANGGLTYLWSPTNGLACASCATTAASPYVTTIYIVTGFDMYGCRNVDTVVVTVDYICADFFVPNVFSPNGDGLNDVVNIHGACIASYNFQIFNRWGELVFETKDPAFSWDGTFRGKPMDTAVFMYSADGITRDGKPFSAKGNITLLR